MLVAKQEPTPCYHDAYSVGTPRWAFGEKGLPNHCKTTMSPLFRHVFLVNKRTLFFFGRLVIWMLHFGRAGIQSLANGILPLVSCRLSSSTSVGG